MNVDEAMAYWKQERTKDDMYYGMPETICDILSAEVEWLRAEVQRLDIAGTHSCHDDCPKLPCVQRREIERLSAELAAAKAASVWPDSDCTVGINYKNEVTVYTQTRTKAEQVFNWLCERMKGGEG